MPWRPASIPQKSVKAIRIMFQNRLALIFLNVSGCSFPGKRRLRDSPWLFTATSKESCKSPLTANQREPWCLFSFPPIVRSRIPTSRCCTGWQISMRRMEFGFFGRFIPIPGQTPTRPANTHAILALKFRSSSTLNSRFRVASVRRLHRRLLCLFATNQQPHTRAESTIRTSTTAENERLRQPTNWLMHWMRSIPVNRSGKS